MHSIFRFSFWLAIGVGVAFSSQPPVQEPPAPQQTGKTGKKPKKAKPGSASAGGNAGGSTPCIAACADQAAAIQAIKDLKKANQDTKDTIEAAAKLAKEARIQSDQARLMNEESARKVREAIEKNKRLLGSRPDDPVPDNGISVGAPKTFDNRTLTLMAEELSATLRGMNLIDPKSLAAAFGLFQGTQTTDVARALTVTTAPIPGQTITDKPSATDPKSRDVSTSTTKPQRDPVLPWNFDMPAAPSGFAPSFGSNPGDLLTDQVNVMYQIFNLRMLQERALSDRIEPKRKEPRLQTVLGFNVSLNPPRNAENAAAIVEVFVKAKAQKGTKDAPDYGGVSLVAMMPQEKTYNRSALSNKSNAFGASAVMKMVTVGYTERRRGQIFYIYRDHDTLALEKMHLASDKLLHFGWQFRPVLGQKSVTPGMRQMFAVLSLPGLDDSTEPMELEVKVVTHWVKYYPGEHTTAERNQVLWTSHLGQALSLLTANSIPNEVHAKVSDYKVPAYSTNLYQEALSPRVNKVRWTYAGDKTLNLAIEGRNFYPGTTAVLGDKTVGDVAGGFILKSPQAIDLNVDLTIAATGEGVLIGRYGNAVPLAECRLSEGRIKLADVSYSPAVEGIRETKILIEVEQPLDTAPTLKSLLPTGIDGESLEPILVFRGKLIPRPYQYRWLENGPLELTAMIPTEEDKFNGVLSVVYPFSGPRLRASIPIADVAYRVSLVNVVKKTVGAQTKDVAREYLIENLSGFFFLRYDQQTSEKRCWNAVFGSKEELLGAEEDKTCKSASDNFKLFDPRIAMLRIQNDDIPSSRKVGLRNPFGGLDFVMLPKDEPEIGKTTLTKDQVSEVQTHDAVWLTVNGDNLSGVAGAFVGEERLEIRVAKDGKSLDFFLPASSTAKAAALDVTFRDSTGKFMGKSRVNVKCNDCAKK